MIVQVARSGGAKPLPDSDQLLLSTVRSSLLTAMLSDRFLAEKEGRLENAVTSQGASSLVARRLRKLLERLLTS